jgi:hypothetical protein
MDCGRPSSPHVNQKTDSQVFWYFREARLSHSSCEDLRLRSNNMGWTFIGTRKTLAQHQDDNFREATEGGPFTRRIIVHEWHPRTWYALIGIYETPESEHPKHVYLRVDMIDTSTGDFGYNDATEEMGPYAEDKPTPEMAAAIRRYIPIARGFAKAFRDRMGIGYDAALETNDA